MDDAEQSRRLAEWLTTHPDPKPGVRAKDPIDVPDLHLAIDRWESNHDR